MSGRPLNPRTGVPARARPALSPNSMLLLALLVPPLAGIALQALAVFGLGFPVDDRTARMFLLLGVGAGAWSVALRGGRLADAGLRGRRPMWFAMLVGFLVALPLLVVRVLMLPVTDYAPPDAEALRSVLFETAFAGLCGQLWLFGVLYNAVRDWTALRRPGRGEDAAVAVCGLLFGLAYFNWLGLAQPSADLSPLRLLYLVVLGVTLALGRRRSGNVSGLAPAWGSRSDRRSTPTTSSTTRVRSRTCSRRCMATTRPSSR